MTSISKNVYIDKLDDILRYYSRYNNTYHSKIKTEPVDVKPSTYIKFSEETNYQDPRFKTGDIVRISKYQNIFVKGYVPNSPEEVFVIKNVKNTAPRTYY